METHTIVGVFESDPQARQAVDRLVEWGFTRDNVHLASAAAMMPGARPGTTTEPAAPPSHANTLDTGISAFFNRIFGGTANLEEVHYYSEAIRRGGTVVVVTSGSDEGADSAADILDDHGAIDIEVHARYLRDSGWQGSPATSTEAGAGSTAAAGDERLVEGELQGRKPARDKSGVRIYTRADRPAPK